MQPRPRGSARRWDAWARWVIGRPWVAVAISARDPRAAHRAAVRPRARPARRRGHAEVDDPAAGLRPAHPGLRRGLQRALPAGDEPRSCRDTQREATRRSTTRRRRCRSSSRSEQKQLEAQQERLEARAGGAGEARAGAGAGRRIARTAGGGPGSPGRQARGAQEARFEPTCELRCEQRIIRTGRKIVPLAARLAFIEARERRVRTADRPDDRPREAAPTQAPPRAPAAEGSGHSGEARPARREGRSLIQQGIATRTPGTGSPAARRRVAARGRCPRSAGSTTRGAGGSGSPSKARSCRRRPTSYRRRPTRPRPRSSRRCSSRRSSPRRSTQAGGDPRGTDQHRDDPGHRRRRRSGRLGLAPVDQQAGRCHHPQRTAAAIAVIRRHRRSRGRAPRRHPATARGRRRGHGARRREHGDQRRPRSQDRVAHAHRDRHGARASASCC